MTPDTPQPLVGLQRLLILLCVSVPSFMINLDSNIVAVSLPAIAQSMHANFADMEWVISAYVLAFASFVMPAGALADRYGRKRMLIIGLSVFTVASFIAGAAGSIAVLNVGRALQGLGGAMLLTAALATLSHSFRGEHRARAFAFWGSVVGIAISLGPVVGGFITQHFGWEWAFYINVPIGAIMVALTMSSMDESRDPNARKVDKLGSITFSGSLFLLTLALITGNHDGWGSTPIVAELVGSAVLFLLFLVVEAKQERPMVDLSIFRRPTYIGANIAGLSYAAALLTMLTYLPFYFQAALGFEPQIAGLMMLPLAVPLFIVPRIATAHLSHRFSGRAMLTMGLGAVAIGLFWVGLQMLHFSYPIMIVGLLLAGMGAGILNGETAKVGMSVIPPERAGMASGISGTMRFTGIVVGFAALGAVLFHRIATTLANALPNQSAADTLALTRNITAGDLSGAGITATGDTDLHQLALHSFGSGYEAILFTGAGIALVAAICSWIFVRASDTPPMPQKVKVVAPPPIAEID